MFRHGDILIDTASGEVAKFYYAHTASWPDILAVGSWPSGTKAWPGTYGRPFRDCRLRVGPRRELEGSPPEVDIDD